MDLSEILSNRIHIKEIEDIINKEKDKERLLNELLALSDNTNKKISDNAAWALTHLCSTKSVPFPKANNLIDKILTSGSETKTRLLLSVLREHEFQEEELRTDFLDYCLERITDCKSAAGIRSLCIHIAYKQCKLFPELKDELRTLLNLMDDNFLQPALLSAKRNTLKLLDKK